jgi:hypothetical membrane protein
MKVSIWDELKRRSANYGITSEVLISSIALCLIGLLFIFFNKHNDTAYRFGIGMFAGGITYCVTRIEKLQKTPMFMFKLILLLGIALIVMSIYIPPIYQQPLSGIGVGLCVGSITYYVNNAASNKKKLRLTK